MVFALIQSKKRGNNMGTIDNRLLQVAQTVKEGARIPIILTLNVAPDQRILRELASTGMTVGFTGKVLPTVSGTAIPSIFKLLASLPYVRSVSYDAPVGAFQYEFGGEQIVPLSESTAYIGARELHSQGITGKGVTIAVLDTGCNKNHPMLYDAIIEQVNVSGGDINDGHGHGTWCASAAAGRPVNYEGRYGQQYLLGVAPEAKVIAIKVLDDSGSGQTSYILRGMEIAVEQKADVLSLSLGSLFDALGADEGSRYIDELSFRHGIMCAVAAGNSFANFTIGSPGGARGAITVGATSLRAPLNDLVATFSSKGPTWDGRVKPNISAPGGNMTDKKEGILAATSGTIAKDAGEQYAPLAGTSMATPHVAGCLALLIQAGMKRDRDFVEQLLAKTVKYPHLKNIFDGWGVIDVAKASKNLNMQKDPNFTFLEQLANTQVVPLMLSPRPAQATSNTMIRLPYMKFGK